jgi:hypothetical protein
MYPEPITDLLILFAPTKIDFGKYLNFNFEVRILV